MADKPKSNVLDNAEFPELKAVVCHFARLCGGAKGVARMLKREYKAAPEGSMLRTMIMQLLVNSIKAVSAKEMAKDVSLISDDDLQAEINKLTAKVQKPASE